MLGDKRLCYAAQNTLGELATLLFMAVLAWWNTTHRIHLLLFIAHQVDQFEVCFEEPLLDVFDPTWQGGTEQQSLDILGTSSIENGLHIIDKAHVEHLIALIQNPEPAFSAPYNLECFLESFGTTATVACISFKALWLS